MKLNDLMDALKAIDTMSHRDANSDCPCLCAEMKDIETQGIELEQSELAKLLDGMERRVESLEKVLDGKLLKVSETVADAMLSMKSPPLPPPPPTLIQFAPSQSTTEFTGIYDTEVNGVFSNGVFELTGVVGIMDDVVEIEIAYTDVIERIEVIGVPHRGPLGKTYPMSVILPSPKKDNFRFPFGKGQSGRLFVKTAPFGMAGKLVVRQYLGTPKP
jgi:hypothetical protein